MSYVVIDLETTIKESYKRKSNPFDSDNKIIIWASKREAQDSVFTIYNINGVDPFYQCAYHLTDLPDGSIIVGQNIKFDLLYLWESESLQRFFRKGGKIWDTMLAEYLLTAQQSTYASLDKLATKYGGTLKDDQIKKMWEVGLDTTEIDPDILSPYAEQDVLNTELVYLKQVEEAKRLGMLPLIEGYMDHLLALTEMEYNGLHVDMQKAEQLKADLTHKLLTLRDDLIGMVRSKADDWPKDLDTFNPGSPEHVSAILFNTPIKYLLTVPKLDEDGNPQVYGPKAQKAGQVICTKELREYIPNGFGLSTIGVTKYKKGGVYTADEKTLSQLRGKAPAFIDLLLEYRETRKLLTTYIYGEEKESGLIPLVQPDGCIHHTLDCVQTKTGRVNSSRPNLQNVPPAVKEIFTSRFGENGRIFEADFSQLEVCVQAYLTQSPKMIQDIKDGVDFHAKRLGYAESIGYDEVIEKIKTDTTGTWALKRKAAKTVSFQKAYGAHPEKIAQETHLPVSTIEQIFQCEDNDYPEIKIFNNSVEDSLKRSRIPTQYKLSIRDKETGRYEERDGEFQGVGFYQSITGKRYHFLEKGSTSTKLRARPGADPYRYFSGPEVANYPVQGCLHGDTSIMTKEGLFPIKELVYRNLEVWSEDGWSKANCVFAGRKKQIKITFIDGREIICSPEHKFLTVIPEDLREVWRDAKELLQDNQKGLRRTVKLGPEVDFVGDVVFPNYSTQTPIGNGFKNISWNDISDKKTLGELLGRLASDGSVRTNKSVVWFFAEHEREVEKTLVPVIQKLGHTSVCSKTNHTQEVRSYMISSTQLAYQSKGLKYDMPSYLFQDKELLRGYLRGMFDGDGTVDKDGIAKLTFGKQAYKLTWARKIQLALNLFGIRSRVRHYPGVRTGVHIMKADAPLFAERIGFINRKKQERLKNGGIKRNSHYFSYIRTVEELPGLVEMYDIVNSENKIYCANGLVTHNTAADIVALSVGSVWRWIKENGFDTSIKLTNEVHDSLVLDINESAAPPWGMITIQGILEDVQGTFKEKLGIGFNVPIKVDVKIGTYWGGSDE